jgi:hypothetical protein
MQCQLRPNDPESCTAINGSLSDSELSELDSESDDYDQLAPSSPDPLTGTSPIPDSPLPAPNAEAERMDTPHTPYCRLITYTARDRHRNARPAVQVERRHSSRLEIKALNAAFCADPDRGIFTTAQLRSDGCAIIPWINESV